MTGWFEFFLHCDNVSDTINYLQVNNIGPNYDDPVKQFWTFNNKFLFISVRIIEKNNSYKFIFVK